MREDDILLGGEVSGHMFFGENWYGVDDGILASCRFLELVAKSRRPASSHFDSLPHLHSTPELKAPCPDDRKFRSWRELAGEIKARYETIDIDGARILFPEGWGLVRASNTNPYLTLRFEGRTAGRGRRHEGADRLRRAPPLPVRTLPGVGRAPRRSRRGPSTASPSAGDAPSPATGSRAAPRSRAGSSRIASRPAARAPSTSTE